METFKSNGGTASGYVASPASGKGPGVIVIQEWWGLIPQVTGVADMLARAGFNALAPDFSHGKSAKIAGLREAQGHSSTRDLRWKGPHDGRAADARQ